MKIIKHCYEERSNIEVPRGGLLGLVIENRLEITNTFAFPITKADEPIDEGEITEYVIITTIVVWWKDIIWNPHAEFRSLDFKSSWSFFPEYTTNMMLHMKKINQDYLHVGWYQSSDTGSFVSYEFVVAQLGYQDSIEESIVVIYGITPSLFTHPSLCHPHHFPIIINRNTHPHLQIADPKKTGRGFLSLKAYRLTPAVLKMLADNEHTVPSEYVKNLHLSFDKMFHEVPIIIRNSPLANALCCQIVEMKPADKGTQFLDLGTS